MSIAKDDPSPRPSNFLRAIIERDLEAGTYAARHFAGTPGDAAHHAGGPLDPARIRTRFPPEPNGYLHIGHAKSICLNFGLAQEYGGVCHLRFDDTNPEKEEQEYVDAILDAVKWLGFDWNVNGVAHLYFASDYFDFMYRAAEALIGAGLAYVDEQSADEMRASRGDFNAPGRDSPFRARTPAENLARFRAMRDGQLADGAAVLRARIDMASPNINLRDPALYRIKRATHHNTGDRWCIYPMYTYAHPIEDALENITHSICTLEFEDQRPFYDWLLDQLCDAGLLAQPRPQQYEFARLNVTTIVTSKRKLRQLVEEGIVDGWDDPRMPTLAGLRRRGYTAGSLRLLAERTGASKAGGWTDYASLDIALRDDLEGQARRAMAVVDPLRLELVNWRDVFGDDASVACSAPAHPQRPELGLRRFGLGPALWIERDDFARHAAERVLSPLSGQQGAPEVRRGRRVHWLQPGRRRPRDGGAGPRAARHAQRHAGRRRRQGQGHHHLGRRARRVAGRIAPLRAAFHRGSARCRRQGLQGRAEPGERARDAGLRRAFIGRRRRRDPRAVRATWLLRCRSRRPSRRPARVQPHHRAQGQLGQVGRRRSVQSDNHPEEERH